MCKLTAQGSLAFSYAPPSSLMRVSSRKGTSLTLSTCTSSRSEKPVALRPLKMLTPFASVAPTIAAGPWHTAEVILPAWKNCIHAR